MGTGLMFVAVFFMLATIALAVLGIVNGTKGIKGFKEAKKAANAKPVASLILGIAGIVYSASALMLAFGTMLMLAVIFA